MNNYFNTPNEDHMQSPFVHNFKDTPFGHIQPKHDFEDSYSLPDVSNHATPNTTNPRDWNNSIIPALHISSVEHAKFPTEPIQISCTHRHQKEFSGQWDQTSSSLRSFDGSDFSPIQDHYSNVTISDILKGTSMPSNLNTGHKGGDVTALGPQEIKRRRRRVSHNLVERRRRDNINERIQELSCLVPMHRLEDAKVRKGIQNNSLLSPTLAGLSQQPDSMNPHHIRASKAKRSC